VAGYQDSRISGKRTEDGRTKDKRFDALCHCEEAPFLLSQEGRGDVTISKIIGSCFLIKDSNISFKRT